MSENDVNSKASIKPPAEVTHWIDTLGAKITGASVALAATLITARDAVGRAFFKSMNKGEAFSDLQDIRDAAIKKVLAPTHRGQYIDSIPEVADINRAYEKKLATRTKMLGVRNVFDEWKILKKHQRWEVIFATGAVASVAIGAILAIASGRSMAKNKKEAQDEAPKQEHSRS